MKKKASLWISGITTVAMLAVAVGSFAAWQTLSKTENFTATAQDPTTVSVATADSQFVDTNILAPSGGDETWVADGKTVKNELTAKVTPKLEGTAPAGAKLTYTLVGNLDSENDSSNFNTYFDVKLYDSTGATAVTTNEVTSDTTYVVKVTFKDAYKTNGSESWNKAAVDAVKNKPVKVAFEVEATKN